MKRNRYRIAAASVVFVLLGVAVFYGLGWLGKTTYKPASVKVISEKPGFDTKAIEASLLKTKWAYPVEMLVYIGDKYRGSNDVETSGEYSSYGISGPDRGKAILVYYAKDHDCSIEDSRGLPDSLQACSVINPSPQDFSKAVSSFAAKEFVYHDLSAAECGIGTVLVLLGCLPLFLLTSEPMRPLDYEKLKLGLAASLAFVVLLGGFVGAVYKLTNYKYDAVYQVVAKPPAYLSYAVPQKLPSGFKTSYVHPKVVFRDEGKVFQHPDQLKKALQQLRFPKPVTIRVVTVGEKITKQFNKFIKDAGVRKPAYSMLTIGDADNSPKSQGPFEGIPDRLMKKFPGPNNEFVYHDNDIVIFMFNCNWTSNDTQNYVVDFWRMGNFENDLVKNDDQLLKLQVNKRNMERSLQGAIFMPYEYSRDASVWNGIVRYANFLYYPEPPGGKIIGEDGLYPISLWAKVSGIGLGVWVVLVIISAFVIKIDQDSYC